MIERRIKQPGETLVWEPFAGIDGARIDALAVVTRGLAPASQSTDVTRPAPGSAAIGVARVAWWQR